MYHSFRVDGVNIGNTQNCGGAVAFHTWFFPLDLFLTPTGGVNTGLSWITSAASDSFYQIVGAPAVGQQLKHIHYSPNYLCMVYDGLKDQAFLNSVISTSGATGLGNAVPYNMVQYMNPGGHFGGIYSASLTCCDGSVIVPGTFFTGTSGGIGVDPTGQVLTTEPVIPVGTGGPYIPGTGIPAGLTDPCDPAPVMMNNPEFCIGCLPGGYYAANGGWGGTVAHPSCQCCPKLPQPRKSNEPKINNRYKK